MNGNNEFQKFNFPTTRAGRMVELALKSKQQFSTVEIQQPSTSNNNIKFFELNPPEIDIEPDPFETDGTSSWKDETEESSDTDSDIYIKKPNKKNKAIPKPQITTIATQSKEVYDFEMAIKSEEQSSVVTVHQPSTSTDNVELDLPGVYSEPDPIVTTAEDELQLAESRSMKLKKSKILQPNPCKSGCQNKCTQKFNELQRQEIFDNYWNLPYVQQKDWILSSIERVAVKRRRSKLDEKKTETRNFFINFEGQKIKVCRQFLLKTLNISSQVVTYTLKNSTCLNTINKDNRGSSTPKNATSQELTESVHSFIESLPKVPSHYCRSKSNRTYLPSEYHSISNIYRVYIDKEKKESKGFVSESIFRRIFKTFNISIHVPKKDKCSFCEATKNFKINEQNQKYLRHMQDKEHSLQSFKLDQERSKNSPSFLCASFDLQKVLNVPHTQSMLFYYTRKYSFYNETVYESGSQTAYNFLWGEIDGKRGANEICSIINRYLSIVDERGNTTSISLYCDSCPGQNKNRQMLTMIYLFLKTQAKNIIEIKLTFLLPGHTYMPVDSVHASIERFVKKRTIWTPSEWVTMISNSRTNPKPYEVIPLNWKDFRDWKSESLKYFSNHIIKNKEGQNFKISEYNIFMFSKESCDIKYSKFQSANCEANFYTLELGRTRNQMQHIINFKEPDILYNRSLPISGPKKKDFENLIKRKLIAERYINEYKQILNTFGEAEEQLPETDEEDDVLESEEI